MPQNAYVPLSEGENSIRVLRIAPSNNFGEVGVVCKLEATTWDTCEYEALSYCWGRHNVRTNILLDGELFEITKDLNAALQELCLPDRVRTLWVDAICINQLDQQEKSTQVQRMGNIYRAAKRVLVWTGPAREDTKFAFQQVERLFRSISISSEDVEAIWSEQGMDSCIQCLSDIIQRPYWSRAWIVQEVVLARDAVLHSGPHTVPFFNLASVLVHPTTLKHLNVTYSLYSYLKQTFHLRSEESEDPALGLFAISYSFRHRLVTEPRDKVFAFVGLLKSPSSIPNGTFTIDYHQKESVIWSSLCKETMSCYQSLLPLAVAEQSMPSPASWCYNWSKRAYEPNSYMEERPLFWSGGLDDPRYYPLQANVFSAAGGLKACIRTDLDAASVIAVRGFTIGEIVAVGDNVSSWTITFGRPNYVQLFQKWESLVGGPWTGEQGEDMTAKFSMTVTGGAWTEKPLDWRAWNNKNYSQRVWDWRYIIDPEGLAKTGTTATGYKTSRHLDIEPNDKAAQYARVRDDTCEGRRMFLLDGAKGFGMGPETCEVGDRVVVLLGCEVPIVLHKKNWKKWRRVYDIEDKSKLYGSTWRVQGQAYVHDVMHYKGDLAQDIEEGKVSLEEYFID